MPDHVTNELIYEVLKNVQERIGLLADDMNGVKARLTSIDTRLGLVHTDMAHLSDRMDKLESRMERVETRLNLNDPRH
jgi:tetrahydromethanopterin S-methyltransferase subunit G